MGPRVIAERVDEDLSKRDEDDDGQTEMRQEVFRVGLTQETGEEEYDKEGSEDVGVTELPFDMPLDQRGLLHGGRGLGCLLGIARVLAEGETIERL